MSAAIIDQCLNLPNCTVAEAFQHRDQMDLMILRQPPVLICSGCGQPCYERYDHAVQRLRDLGIFAFHTYLILEKWRVICRDCGVRVEHLGFARPYARFTVRFEECVARLCELLPIAQVADLLHLDWKTVKEIDKRALERRFAVPDYSNLRLLAVDELSYRPQYQYLTNVFDLERGRLVWSGKGRSEAVLHAFFDEIGPQAVAGIEAISIDEWEPYRSAIRKRAPQAKIVYDKYHVIEKYGREVITRVRTDEYRRAEGEGREVLKGTKYILLKRPDRLREGERARVEQLLDLNENLNKAYILRDALVRLWECTDPREAEGRLNDWLDLARTSGVPALIKFADSLERHADGIVNHSEYAITSAQVEGFHNKIKTVKRKAYGFRDLDYFALKMKQACPGKPP